MKKAPPDWPGRAHLRFRPERWQPADFAAAIDEMVPYCTELRCICGWHLGWIRGDYLIIILTRSENTDRNHKAHRKRPFYWATHGLVSLRCEKCTLWVHADTEEGHYSPGNLTYMQKPGG